MSVVVSENTTTRRHPRSLADAFPDERANAVEVYRRPAHALIGPVVGFIAAVMAAVMLFFAAMDAAHAGRRDNCCYPWSAAK